MLIRQARLLIPLAIATLALTGCATEPPSSHGSQDGGDSPDTSDSAPTSGNTGGGSGNPYTVTVNDDSWEYSSFQCAVGYEQTSSDEYSFSSGAMKTADGKKIQFLVDVADSTGQNRVSGDGVRYTVTVFDYEDPENPSVDVHANGTTGVTISGDSVKVSGDFTGLDSEIYTIDAKAVCD